MVTDALIDFIVSMVQAVADAWPTVDLNLGGFESAFSNLGALNYFLPIAETAAAVLAVYAIGPALALSTLILWLTVGVVRGGSSRA